MNLIFPKITFIVIEGNPGTVEQSLGKSHNLDFVSMVHIYKK